MTPDTYSLYRTIFDTALLLVIGAVLVALCFV